MKNAHTKNADLMEISFTTSGTIQKGKVAGWDLYRGKAGQITTSPRHDDSRPGCLDSTVEFAATVRGNAEPAAAI
jgi:hypothetical protein